MAAKSANLYVRVKPDVTAGRAKPARHVFDDIRKDYDIRA